VSEKQVLTTIKVPESHWRKFQVVAKMWGYSASDLINQYIKYIGSLCPEDRPEMPEAIKKMFNRKFS